jgi:hypothetical protein
VRQWQFVERQKMTSANLQEAAIDYQILLGGSIGFSLCAFQSTQAEAYATNFLLPESFLKAKSGFDKCHP